MRRGDREGNGPWAPTTRFALTVPPADLPAMTERRYTEDEVATIFARAAEAQQAVRRQLPAGEGLTLADRRALRRAGGVRTVAAARAVGRGFGIRGELVDPAARSVDLQGSEAPRRFLGLPIGVSRTVELGRRLTDDEWERLVVDLRETFDARGRVAAEGSLRQWTNGNLQALLEPKATGHRLRLRTLMGRARGLMSAGIALGVGSTAILVASAAAGDVAPALERVGVMLAAGTGLFGMGAVQLPRWARLRRRQMEGVAARVALGEAALPGKRPDELGGGGDGGDG